MKILVMLILIVLLPGSWLGAAVIVTQRGEGLNVFQPPLLSDRTLDIDNDGTPDFRFVSSGIQAILVSLGNNRFVGFADPQGLLSDQVTPVSFGHYITPEGPFPSGNWHRGTDNGNTLGFLLGYANSGIMQFADGYIAVEFERTTGTHYGFIKYVGYGVAQLPLYDLNGQIVGYTNGIPYPGGLVDEWGWETTPGTGLLAGTPEPGRGVLMLGGCVWLVLRRRRAALGVG